MTFEITLAVLLAALLHASWNAMIKGGSDVLLDTAAIVAGAGLLAVPFLFVVPLPNAASWPYIVASITTHLAYYFLMVNAYRTGELSLVYPLMRGVAPLITAVLGIVWLRELPAPISWLGMLMISIGVIALALPPAGNAPVLAGHGRAVGFALANAAVIAVYTIIDGTGARLAGNPWSYIVWLFVLDAIPFSIYMLVTRRQAFFTALAERRWHGMIGGGLS
ncbi:MAG TPA: EamA family transporter, partial [Burkholderiaceae bacterium]|nr:EamA family transporter [Burkholderiaceae bacterium]